MILTDSANFGRFTKLKPSFLTHLKKLSGKQSASISENEGEKPVFCVAFSAEACYSLDAPVVGMTEI